MKATIRILVERDDGKTCSGEMHFDGEPPEGEQPLSDAEVAAHVAAEASIHLLDLLRHDHSGDEVVH